MSISHVKEFSLGQPLPLDLINLYLDDVRFPYMTYTNLDAKIGIPSPEWTLVRTVESAKELLSFGLVRVISFDHDLGMGDTGYDLIKWIHKNNHWHNIEQIYVHSANPIGARNIKQFADRYFHKKAEFSRF
jgi:hypothetical protein